MRYYLLSAWTLMLLLSLFMGCDELTCDGDELDFTFSGDLIVTGQEAVSKPITIQYPTDCDGKPKGEYFTVQIMNPNAIPGLNLSMIPNSVSEFWFGYEPSANGQETISIYAFPSEDNNGLLTAPQPGTYQITLEGSIDNSGKRTKILTVQVLGDGLNLVIREPNANSRYFDYDTTITVSALARDQEYGIASVDYRLDSSAWVNTPFNNQLQAEFKTAVDIPTPGSHTIHVRAINGQGNELIKSQEFFIPDDPNYLSEVRWDGGGDNLTLNNPLNWENDRVPTQNDHAIIESSVTSRVRLENTGFQARAFSVGAFDIEAELELSGNVWIGLAGKEQTSTLSSVTFEVQNGDQRPEIKFIVGSRDNQLVIDKCFMAEMTLESFAENEVVVNEGIIEAGSFNGFAQAFINGRVNLIIEGTADFAEPVFWEFDALGTDFVSGTLTNQGTWNMMNGSTFTTLGGAESKLVNEGQMIVDFNETNPTAAFVITGEMNVQSLGQWRIFDNVVNNNTEVIFTSSSEETNLIHHFQNSGKVTIEDGRWSFESENSKQSRELIIDNGAEVEIDNGSYSAGVITVQNGATLNLGPGLVGDEVVLKQGTLEMDESCEIGKLILEEAGFFKIGSVFDSVVVDANEVIWLGAEDLSESNLKGAVLIDGAGRMTMDAGSTGEFVWSTDIVLDGGGKLVWESGSSYSKGGNFKTVHLDMLTEFTSFDINAERNLRWGFFSLAGGAAQSYLKINNRGTITVAGDGDVEVAGCLFNLGNGVLTENRSGQFVLINSPGFCE